MYKDKQTGKVYEKIHLIRDNEVYFDGWYFEDCKNTLNGPFNNFEDVLKIMEWETKILNKK